MVEATIENEELEVRLIKINEHLKEENKLFSETLFAMYNILSQIDFGAYDGELKMCFGDTLKYDLVPWEQWETVLDVCQTDMLGVKKITPVQLRLF